MDVNHEERTPATLELERVVKHYADVEHEVAAVDDVSLTLAPGEILSLQGPSGSGKTTLLLLSAVLIAPDRGVIRYRGDDVAAFRSNDARLAEIGLIHQSYHLMPRVSALENAAMTLLLRGVRQRVARARALPWLEQVGLGDRLEHTPEQLSAGERQRVALARELATEPRLILADEPTANLDSACSRQVVELLQRHTRERESSVLLVTHDSEVAALADRHCHLRDGRIVHRATEPGAPAVRECGPQPQRGHAGAT